MATPRQPSPLEDFLQPLAVDVRKCHSLARSLCDTFTRLAKESQEQFLPTPISDSILKPEADAVGRYLAIDIGGTNLRVGFIELLGRAQNSLKNSTSSGNPEENGHDVDRSRVKRHLEKSWPIGEQLKMHEADALFAWIGRCIAEVVQDGCLAWPEELPDEIPLGVTFSFPMIQHTLSDATLMGMGKGFAMSASLDLGKQLLEGYETSRDPNLPRIKITAIANDAVSTLVSFAYQLRSNPRRKAGMGLIVGTGCNATIPLALSKLHPSKRPKKVKVLDHPNPDTDIKINVNTEWTIKGAAKPLHDLGFITRWDSKLDAEGEAPGFQPFEYMTAGRYLGELGRIIIVEYFTQHLSIPLSSLPLKLRKRMGLTTTFLGNLGPHLASVEASMVKQLETELPPPEDSKWTWTEETTQMAFKIAKAIQVRAAGMVAAAVIGLLTTADEIHFPSQSPLSSFPHLPNGTVNSRTKLDADIEELMVGYTGGTIVHFQDYLRDCQGFLDAILREEFGDQGMDRQPRVVLSPCHDGGILGAGILAGTVRSNAHDV